MKFKLIPYFAVLFISLFSILPFFSKGFFPMHDDTQVARVYEMTKSLSEGMFPVRWVADLGYGYGYPIFNFYGPLPYYIGGIINLVGLDSLIATKIMFVIGILLSGISMYVLVSKFFGKLSGVVSSIIYIYFPYHAVNIYVRGAVGELFAYAFLPLLFYGIFAIYEGIESKTKIRFSDVIIYSIFLTLIMISHTVSILMLSVILPLLFIILLFISKRKLLSFWTFVVSTGFGILFSSFFTLPAFFEKDLTNVSSQIGGGANFSDHFVCLSQFVNSQWGFGGSVPGCIDGMSFILGKLNILLLLISIIFFCFVLVKNNLEKLQLRLILVSIAFLFISLFMQIGISKFVWTTFSFMEYIQYPWRFMNFTALFGSFVIGSLIFMISKINSKVVGLVSFLIIIGVLFFNTKLFKPQEINNVDSNFYTNPITLHFKTSKMSDEYLPKEFRKPIQESDIYSNEVFIQHGSFKILESKTQELKFSYAKETTEPIVVYRTFFPGWKATINGKKINITSYNNSFIKLDDESSNGNVILKLQQTPIQIIGNLLTLIAIAGIFAVIIVKPLKIRIINLLSDE